MRANEKKPLLEGKKKALRGGRKAVGGVVALKMRGCVLAEPVSQCEWS